MSGELFAVVELVDLEGWEVVDRAVGALRDEPEHPGRGRGLNLVDVPPGTFVVDEPGLVERFLLSSFNVASLLWPVDPGHEES